MQNKKLLFVTLLMASCAVFADQTLLDGATAAGKTMEQVEAVKGAVADPAGAATTAVKEKIADTVKQTMPATEAPKMGTVPAAVIPESSTAPQTTEATPVAKPNTNKVKKHTGKKHHKKRHH
jgi:apolipoprotein N-acyltransferase